MSELVANPELLVDGTQDPEAFLRGSTLPERWPFARRSRSYASSPWADIWSYLDRHPDSISFCSGGPSPALVPVERLKAAAAAVWADLHGYQLGYGDVAGHSALRELIARHMSAQGTAVSAEQIIITNGSQGGIDLITRLFVDPGDLVVVEAPTYIGALQVFETYEASYLMAPMDDQGLDVAALEGLLDQSERAPKLVYTVPTFQNPTGVTMSAERRVALVELARRRGLLVVEDDPYGELWYDTLPPPSLRSLSEDVVFLGTFSKTIAPGLRVGWMVAPQDLIVPLVTAREAGDIHNERVTSRIVRATAEGFLDGHIAEARAVYRRRRDAMMSALAEYLPPELTWTEPGGGFFVWIRLPEECGQRRQVPELFMRAADAGALILPGSLFYPDGSDPLSFRLSFSNLPEERITEGVRRLGMAVSEVLPGS